MTSQTILKRFLKPSVLIGVLIAIAILALGLRKRRDTGGFDLSAAARCRVERGELTITVLQTGELAAKKSKQITNETDSSAKILEIVEDGARVKKGDLLVELDLGEFKDQVLNAESGLARAEASHLAKEKELEIGEFKYKNDLESAKLKVSMAELDLKKYTEAEYPNQVLKAEVDIQLAKEELSRSQKKLEYTERLVQKEFASKEDLETARLEVQRRQNDIEAKTRDMKILREYTHGKDLKQLQNALSNAQVEIKTLTNNYESDRQRRLAELASNKTELDVSRNRLERLREQLKKGKVYSEYDGQVFYPARQPWRSEQPIEKGTQIYPRMTILEFPDLSAWTVNAGVPESIIERIQTSQTAVVSVDAMPDVILNGVVSNIGVVPDQRRWDQNVKTYNVVLDVVNPPKLPFRPGMSVMVDIIVDELKDVLHVPIQAVSARGDERFVYAVKGKSFEPVVVKTGKFNEESIEVLSGVKEGQELLLYAPVDKETRTAVKERPLEKQRRSGKNGEKADAEPGATPAAGDKPSDAASRKTASEDRPEAKPTPAASPAPQRDEQASAREGERRERPARPANWESMSEAEREQFRSARRAQRQRSESPRD